MLFENFKKSLSEKIERCYILWGDDRYLKDNATSNLLSYFRSDFDDFNITYFGGDVAMDEILTNSENMPLGADKRIFVIKDYKFVVENKKRLSEYLRNANPTSYFVFSTEKEEIVENATNINCNKLDKNILGRKIKYECKSKKRNISNESINLLIEYCDYDMGKILQELEKITNTTIENEEITVECITKDVSRSDTYNIFELTDALGKKDIIKANKILSYLMKNSQDNLIGLLYNYFRRLMYVSMFKDSNDYEIANALGVKAFAITKAREQYRSFGKEKLQKIVFQLGEIDERIKNSFANIEAELYNVLYFVLLSE